MFSFYSFLILNLFNFSLRLLAVTNYRFAFTWDQARDLIDIRHLTFAHQPLLVGPTTGLTGVFVGPFWYYFNALPLWLSIGDPSSVVVWQILWFLLAGLFIFLFFRRLFPFNLFFSLLFLFSPLYFHTTHYSLNPNLLPIFFLILFTILPYFHRQAKLKHFFFWGIFLGISLQIEAAMAILFLPLTIGYFLIRRFKPKIYPPVFLGFSLTLIPQIIYELRHNFSMTKLVLNQLTGTQDYLTNKLTFQEKFVDIFNNFQQSLVFTFRLPLPIILALLTISLLYLYRHRQQLERRLNASLSLMLIFYFLSFIFYLFYPFRIYLWYLHSFGIIYLFIISLFFYLLFTTKNSLHKIISISIFLFLIIWGSLWQINFINDSSKPSSNPSQLKNRLTVIDWIYSQASNQDRRVGGQGFQVYTYSPAIEDRPYHYLFWWYGPKTYGYQPAVVSFQLDSTHYLPDNQRYWTKTKPLSEKYFIFLVLEPGDHLLYPRSSWLNQFQDLCLVETKDFAFQIKVEKRIRCD